jgi:hypothetical protein
MDERPAERVELGALSRARGRAPAGPEQRLVTRRQLAYALLELAVFLWLLGALLAVVVVADAVLNGRPS